MRAQGQAVWETVSEPPLELTILVTVADFGPPLLCRVSRVPTVTGMGPLGAAILVTVDAFGHKRPESVVIFKFQIVFSSFKLVSK